MIHLIKSNDIREIFHLIKHMIYGVLLTIAILAVVFLKMHWKGFSKFLSDPAFFDNVEIVREFEVKK